MKSVGICRIIFTPIKLVLIFLSLLQNTITLHKTEKENIYIERSKYAQHNASTIVQR